MSFTAAGFQKLWSLWSQWPDLGIGPAGSAASKWTLRRMAPVAALLAALAIGLPSPTHTRRAASGPPVPAASRQASAYGFPHTPKLEVGSIREHGKIVEIRGRTEPGATVMINADPAPVLDGEFTYFAGPLPSGLSVLTVTAQTLDGGVNTQPVTVLVD